MPRTDAPRPAPLEWLYLAIGLALVLRYRWLLDDAFVYFRYVDNFLFLDLGLVFNAGEQVEGYSSPLHCLLLVLLRLSHLDWMTLTTLLGCACFALFWFLLIRLNRELARGRAIVNLPLAYLTVCYGVTAFFTSGLETPLAQAMAPVIALRLLRPGGLLLDAGVAAAPLARPELALATLATLGFAAWRSRRIPWRLAGLTLGINGAWLLFRIHQYADLLPNTYYLKNDTQIAQGLVYVGDLVRTYHPLGVGIALAALRLAARRYGREPEGPEPEETSRGARAARLAMAGVALAVGAYVVKVGGAALHYWYLAFPFTLLVCASAGLAEGALARLGLDRRPAATAAATLALSLWVFSWYPRQLSAHPIGRAEEPRQIGVIGDASYHRHHPTLRPASWRGRVRPEDMRAFAPQLAARGYDEVVTGTWCRSHWERYRARVVHGFGLTEPILARVRTPEIKPGHKPALRRLAEDLAALRRDAKELAPGLARRAARAGRAPGWIAEALDAIEVVERKMYNRHDWRENLGLALRFPGPIELPAPVRSAPGAASGGRRGGG